MDAIEQMRAALIEDPVEAQRHADALESLWSVHFAPVTLRGVVHRTEEEVTKQAIAELLSTAQVRAARPYPRRCCIPFHPDLPSKLHTLVQVREALLGLYIHYGSVRVESSATGGLDGSTPPSRGCSVVLRRVGWVRLISVDLEYAEAVLARQLFDAVNEARNAVLEAATISALHAGIATLHSRKVCHPCLSIGWVQAMYLLACLSHLSHSCLLLPPFSTWRAFSTLTVGPPRGGDVPCFVRLCLLRIPRGTLRGWDPIKPEAR